MAGHSAPGLNAGDRTMGKIRSCSDANSLSVASMKRNGDRANKLKPTSAPIRYSVPEHRRTPDNWARITGVTVHHRWFDGGHNPSATKGVVVSDREITGEWKASKPNKPLAKYVPGKATKIL